MIIKGGPAGNVAFWARHLLRDDTNEVARLVEVRGLLASDLRGALREMQAIAAQSRSRGNFMYQANINPPRDAHLTSTQFALAVDRLEQNLGLQDRQRVVVEHIKGGRRHYHVIWNRVEVTTLKVADITGNYAVHAATSRELEQMFGLTPASKPQTGRPRQSRGPELWEQRAAERSGIDRSRVEQDLLRIWTQTTTGETFRSAALAIGYVLAKGDRRDFCIVDQAGDVHSLSRRLRTIRAADVRTRFADLDRDRLPTVAEARAAQRLRAGFGQATASTVGLRQRRQAIRAALKRRETGRAFREATGQLRPSRPGRAAPAEAFKPTIEDGASGRIAGWMGARGIAPPMQACSEGPVRPGGGSVRPISTAPPSLDSSALGRAEAAYAAEFAKWAVHIDVAQSDRSLNADQRASAVAALRSRQRLEAESVRRRIVEEEVQRVRAVRRRAKLNEAQAAEPSP